MKQALAWERWLKVAVTLGPDRGTNLGDMSLYRLQQGLFDRSVHDEPPIAQTNDPYGALSKSIAVPEA